MPQDNSIPLQAFQGESPIDNYLTAYTQSKQLQRQQQADARANVVAGQQDQQFQWQKEARDQEIAAREASRELSTLRDGDQAGFSAAMQRLVAKGYMKPEEASRYTVADLPALRARDKEWRDLQTFQLNQDKGRADLRQTNAQIGLIGAQTDAAKANAEFIRTNKGNPAGKPLSTQMNNEFGTLGDTKSQVNNFLATFKPEFASRGVGFGFGANTMNAFDRATGGSDASTWWQGYDKYKNTVRHGLFGGALTPNEQAAFDAADIGPGMNDKTILANLAIQKQIVEGAIARRSNSAAAQGFNKEAIDALTGSGNYTINQGDAAGTVRGGNIPTVTTKAQFDALPSGSIYTESDGKRYRKP